LQHEKHVAACWKQEFVQSPVMGIRDILVWIWMQIRILGSIPLTNVDVCSHNILRC